LITNRTDGAEVGDLAFYTMRSGTVTEAARILGNGNVGIGATAPVSTLQVTGTNQVTNTDTPNLFITVTDSQAVNLGGTLGFGLIISGSNLRSLAQVSGRKADSTSGNGGGYLTLDTSTLDGTMTERVRVTSAGHVGIGVAAPARTLSVHRDDSYAVVQITHNSTGVTDTDGFQLQQVGLNSYVYNYENGNMYFGTNQLERMSIGAAGAVAVVGSFSKGSGSFKIDHPLPALNETHNLIHSFIEGPRADLIYRGTVVLVDGSATVDLDVAAGMTVGTWVLLCRDEQVFTTNETSYNHIRGSVSGSTLTIECEEATCTDSVSWMVVAERQDQHMRDSNTEWTDENGRPIIEPLKTSQSEPAPSGSASISPSASASPSA
jgi:hypothetical protein